MNSKEGVIAEAGVIGKKVRRGFILIKWAGGRGGRTSQTYLQILCFTKQPSYSEKRFSTGQYRLIGLKSMLGQWMQRSVVVVKLLGHVRLLRPHGLCPARLLCPGDSPGKNTGVGCHFLLQGIFPFPSPGDLPNPGIEARSPTLQADSLSTELQEKRSVECVLKDSLALGTTDSSPAGQ